jgi:group I intron endonuclease
MISGVIYCATSPSNKKYYGYSLNFKGRKAGHIKDAKNGKSNYFYKAIRKYGAENFDWKIIEEYNKENKLELKKILCEREIYWIGIDKTYISKFGYNMTKGGDGRVGIPHTKETKEKISKSTKGRIHSQETKLKMSESAKGKIISDEQRKSISKTLTGLKQSQETIEKRRIKLKGIYHYWNVGKSPPNKGVPMSDETKRKISEKCKGFKHPKDENYRKKISEGLKKYHQNKNKNE